MIWAIISISIIILILFYIIYAFHQKVEKLSSNQAIMLQWFEVLRENDEQLLNDLKRINYELQKVKKTKRKG